MIVERKSTRSVSEEAFGLRPTRAAVAQPHLLQWIDPTYDEAEPQLEIWLHTRLLAMEAA